MIICGGKQYIYTRRIIYFRCALQWHGNKKKDARVEMDVWAKCRPGVTREEKVVERIGISGEERVGIGRHRGLLS